MIWFSACLILGVFSFVEQILGCSDVLRGLVEDGLHVGEVGQTVLNLHNHLVHRGLVDRQGDGQDLPSHLLYALRVCALGCTEMELKMKIQLLSQD